MEEQQSMTNFMVIWRGKKLNVEMNSGSTLKDFGHKLQKLTNVKADTMRLLIPRSSDKSSKLITPFSDEYSSLSLHEASVFEGKTIRMMGVFEDEIEKVSQNAKSDMRIAGFDEEEKRLRQRMLDRPQMSLKLPQGAYIFCDFRTLHIPGIDLNPPASEALKRMHMLAADPGIVAIMNKHRWRVGIMTEMAPEGYVGVSPECILGYNKNHGEEISLRLRTDDLKGFRKYESIKKTLLHELAHMVYSEHDANFYALDKQLNQEAINLDWTKLRGHTLSSVRRSEHYEEEFYAETGSSSHSQKLGGRTSDKLASARASSVAAAYRRLENVSTSSSGGFEVHEEPDPDDSLSEVHEEPDPDDFRVKDDMEVEKLEKASQNLDCEPDPDDSLDNKINLESDLDDSQGSEAMESESYSGINEKRITFEPDPDDCEMIPHASHLTTKGMVGPKTHEELDPDDFEVALKHGVKVDLNDPQAIETVNYETQPRKIHEEPDPDDCTVKRVILEYGRSAESDLDDSLPIETVEHQTQLSKTFEEPDPDDSEVKGSILEKRNHGEPDSDDSQAKGIMQAEPDPDDYMDGSMGSSSMQADIPNLDDQELQRIQDPVTAVCSRLQKAIEILLSEVNPMEATSVLQTLFKIIRNVIEHPDEIKFKKLRKANPLFQRNVANYKAAMEVLFLVGFNEDVVPDEMGRVETYVVLKRNDPGLLWLAKSSLEMCIAH
ncbi:hypothetical protein HHK36_023927 [Tetracentron sinense]|uniref:WLM domain-containing protein n=1 Tax=Tetracentron sinense TaxID=13715 RepID=A0A835D6A8_TETSI|nr:hypothetical protein HHK36_023927 [Tetracentron sinense]